MISAKELKKSVDIKEVLEFYGIEFNRGGFASCPFHYETKPSLTTGKSVFTCFSCGAHGDVIDFVSRYFNINFVQALQKINDDFCLGLDRDDTRTKKERSEDVFINKAISAVYEKMQQDERELYDKFCDEYRAISKAYPHLDPDSTESKYIADRIEELEKVLDHGVEYAMLMGESSKKNRARR